MKLEYRSFFSNSDTATPAKTCFLWLHGYGASMDDLVPLKDAIRLPFLCDWFFPNAPMAIPISPYMEGRAWFPIDQARLQRATTSGTTPELFKDSLPDGYDDAMTVLKSFISEHLSGYENILIGGFSQGSMLASRLALTMKRIKLGVFFSSTFFDQNSWDALVGENPNLLTFQSHGVSDQVLPLAPAKKLDALLERASKKHFFMDFNGGHEIPLNVIQVLNEKIQAWSTQGELELR